MSYLCYRLLFRKNGAFAAVLAIALLVAIVASMTAIVNFVNSQTSQVGQLASVGNKYLLLNKNGATLSDSRLNHQIVNSLNFSDLKSCSYQKILSGSLLTSSGVFNVSIRGVDDVDAYLKTLGASLNGSVAKTKSEVNFGVLLADVCSVNPKDTVSLSVGGVELKLKVAGTVRTLTQLDSELIVPLETANALADNADLSFVEFTFKSNVNLQEALNRLSAALPSNVEVVKVQQTSMFLQQSVGETLNFLAVWSISVYFVVAATSYVVSTRLIVDSDYELAMLKAVGAKRGRVFFWVFSFSVMVALAGSVLGLAVGLVGTQVASAGLRWFWQNVQVTTFLEPVQVGQILLFSVVFSAVGCFFPAYRGVTRI
ncbi:MAG: ABC transporter permease [Candidatus Bathyarchaeia archaeon]|jgi:ABC-type lipoprotein release transport system permease subunit